MAIPRASLNKYIKDILPDARLAIETRELLLSCCHKFIHQLSTEANAACARANKKTINPEHIISGMARSEIFLYCYITVFRYYPGFENQLYLSFL